MSPVELKQQFSAPSVNARIIRAIFTIGGLGFAVKILIVIKDILLAERFGTSSEFDAYVVAFTLFTFCSSLLFGSLESAFIPTYVQVRDAKGESAARQLFAAMLGRGMVFLLAFVLILGLLSSPLLRLIGSGFADDTGRLSQQLFQWMLPALILMGLAAIFGAVLNANHRFASVALAPAAIPILTIVFLLFGTQSPGVSVLVLALIVGTAIQIVFLLRPLSRAGLMVVPGWKVDQDTFRTITNQYIPVLVGMFFLSGTELVDKAMATPLGPGNVSALNYSYKLVALVLNTAALALGTAVLPHFSQMVAARDWQGIRRTLRVYGLLIVVCSVPLTAVLVACSTDIVRLVFQRGAFTESDTRLVGSIQAFYLLQIPFYFIGILIVRLISALKVNVILMWGAVISLTVNIILNYLFIQVWGVAGIALSTSGVYVISISFLGFMLWRKLRQLERMR